MKTNWIAGRKRIYESTSNPLSVLPETNPRNVIAFIISRLKTMKKGSLRDGTLNLCLHLVNFDRGTEAMSRLLQARCK